MPEVTTWGYAITDDLLQLFYLRKTVLSDARPDCLSFDSDIKYATTPWRQYEFPDLALERRKKFLRHPSGS